MRGMILETVIFASAISGKIVMGGAFQRTPTIASDFNRK